MTKGRFCPHHCPPFLPYEPFMHAVCLHPHRRYVNIHIYSDISVLMYYRENSCDTGQWEIPAQHLENYSGLALEVNGTRVAFPPVL